MYVYVCVCNHLCSWTCSGWEIIAELYRYQQVSKCDQIKSNKDNKYKRKNDATVMWQKQREVERETKWIRKEMYATFIPALFRLLFSNTHTYTIVRDCYYVIFFRCCTYSKCIYTIWKWEKMDESLFTPFIFTCILTLYKLNFLALQFQGFGLYVNINHHRILHSYNNFASLLC